MLISRPISCLILWSKLVCYFRKYLKRFFVKLYMYQRAIILFFPLSLVSSLSNERNIFLGGLFSGWIIFMVLNAGYISLSLENSYLLKKILVYWPWGFRFHNLRIENEECDFKQPQDWSLFTTRLKNNFLKMRQDGTVVSSSGSGISR